MRSTWYEAENCPPARDVGRSRFFGADWSCRHSAENGASDAHCG